MPNATAATIPSLVQALERGETTSRRLVEDCLARIADPDGEGARAFVSVDAVGARAAADAMDLLRKAGAAPSPLAGIPVAIKDLADIRGQVTTAGSKALADRPAASADAPVVARMRAAGLVVIGRANMVEFAYSGIGANPHYGTPAAPWDRANRHVPGGSSSGSAVAVADGMAFGALGTDTGGSCRIPAAYCGVTGMKPTARRVPTDNVVPLSTSLDSIGPIARTVDCCALLDSVMAGESIGVAPSLPLTGLRLLVPTNIVLEKLDKEVAADFDGTLAALAKAGAVIIQQRFEPFEMIRPVLNKGGLSASESYAWHKELITAKRNVYDPRVAMRILMGETQSAADYIGLLDARRAAVAAYVRDISAFDAIVSPTCPILPPREADLVKDEDYTRLNMLSLRNTLMINILDGCSIALPMSAPDKPPTSLMVSGAPMTDRRVLGIARSIETALGVR
ncbi:MAG: amidase [Hyphomicrobiaceae bacterium]|nr:amidase [Hyphomicrobiaceae bacterium]